MTKIQTHTPHPRRAARRGSASRRSRLAAFLALALALAPLGAGAQGSDIPGGAIAFFTATACPAGWSELDDAKGRLVVAVKEGVESRDDVYGAVLPDVDPFSTGGSGCVDDIEHKHSYTAEVDMGSHHIASLGGGNKQGADTGTQHFDGKTDDGTSGLNFTVYKLCRKDHT
ncbi:MAG: hypothetical protein AAGM22_23235 [Acidobacteriota bacterium]